MFFSRGMENFSLSARPRPSELWRASWPEMNWKVTMTIDVKNEVVQAIAKVLWREGLVNHREIDLALLKAGISRRRPLRFYMQAIRSMRLVRVFWCGWYYPNVWDDLEAWT